MGTLVVPKVPTIIAPPKAKGMPPLRLLPKAAVSLVVGKV